MFCLKCSEAIPDGSEICPKCGANLKEKDDEQAVINASQKEIEETIATPVDTTSKKSFYMWCVFAVVSLIFLALNYFKVSIDLYFSGTSDTSYSGYKLIECLEGSVGTSGYMVILLIITNIAVFITGIIGARGNVLKVSILKGIMIVESIFYLIATIVPYFNIKSVLAEFDSDLSTTSIGIGCYLNIILAVIAVIYYFASINKQLKDE